MLTPVRAASNASFSSQGQSASFNADSLVRAATAIAPVQQIETTDLNSAITGKLSILLLAVRERMVEALLDALNTAGDALSLPRDDAETNLVFASRLADAIQKLPASKVAQVERQLTAQGHDIPVRLLGDALKNPAGPEAARVVAYLETMRYKDRDLAARAVNRSYGQNDASPLRPEQRAEVSIQRANRPAADKATIPAQKDRASGAPPKPVTVAVANSNAMTTEKPATLAGHVASVQDTRLNEKVATSTVKEQQRPSADLAALASEDVDRIAPDMIEEAAPTEPHPSTIPTPKADPVIPKSWAGIPASLSDDATDMIVAIIRDQESEILLEAVDIDPAVDIDVMLDDALIGDIPDELTRPSDQPALQNAIARQSSPLTAQPASDAAAINAAANRQTTHQAEPRPADMQTIDAAYAPVLMKIVEGVPYATQPYQFAKDETEDGGSREMHREDHDAGPQSEEQEADGESNPSEDDAAEEMAMLADDASDELAARQPGIDAQIPLLPAPGLAMPVVAEEAYAFYRRMVGWE